MLRQARNSLLIGFLALVTSQSILAQAPMNPPQPVPVAPPDLQGTLPSIPMPANNSVVPPTTPFALPPLPGPQTPPSTAVFPDRWIPSLAGFYGWFEISLLFPEFHGSLSGPVAITGLPTSTVTLGGANLDGTGSPRLEIGYRLGEGLGAVAVTYRSIVTKGASNIPAGVLGEGFLSSLMNFNIVDVDYVSQEFCIAPRWDFAWRVGLRIAGAYYNNEVVSTFGNAEATSNFVGAGPHAELEIARALTPSVPGLAVLAKLDGAVLVGRLSQSFEETLQTSPPIGGATVTGETQSVPVLTFDIGLSYAPPGCLNWARFGFGYEFEYWWGVGSSGSSRGDLSINGLYFRGEFNF